MGTEVRNGEQLLKCAYAESLLAEYRGIEQRVGTFCDKCEEKCEHNVREGRYLILGGKYG